MLTWHPKLPLLTVGWRDGKVSFWSAVDRRVNEDGATHDGQEITVVTWSSDGERLITGDVDGRVGVWRVDGRNRPVPIIQYQDKGARVTHVVVPPREDAEAAGGARCGRRRSDG